MSGSLVARIGLACFASGVILLYRLTALPPSHWVILVTGLAFLPALFARYHHGKVGGPTPWLLVGLLMSGIGWAAWHSEARLNERLPRALEGQSLEVSGYLCGVPEPGSYGSVRFAFCVSHWHNSSVGNLPSRLRLSWYGDDAHLDLPARLRLTVVLKRPHGAVNPYGFRYESWLFRKGYGATGSIRRVAEDASVDCGLVCSYHQWRHSLVDGVSQHLAETKSAPLIASLMLGYRGDLEPHHWQVLKATGTIHLVAISGLHLGLVAIAVAFVIRRLLIWLPETWLPPARMRALIFFLVCSASFVYALAAGFSVPTRRALIMVVVGCWWVFSSRKSQPLDAVLLALFLVLLADPLSPLDQGFWLSFGAVGVLTLVFSGLRGQKPWWQSLLIAQVAIFATLWPVLAFLDQPQPAIGFFTNLIAIPLVSLLIMPAIFVCALVLLMAPVMGEPVIAGLDLLLRGFWWFLERASALELPLVMPSVGELICAAVVTVLALLMPFFGFRVVVAASMCIWFGVSSGPRSETDMIAESSGSPELWVWDVGQGLSVLVRSNGKTLLYDTGPELEGVYSAVESVILPNLRGLGVQHIDTLVISHADNDHSGGIPLLLERLSVGRIVSGEPDKLMRRLGHQSGFEVEPCFQRQDKSAGKLSYWRSGGDVEGNDASCVLTLSFNEGRQTLILSGDVTDETERAFLNQWSGKGVNNDGQLVVLAPHHGSKTSSSVLWVEQLSPSKVIFSAGYRHRYGHPHPDVVNRYRVAGSELLNTATSGAVRMVFGPNGIKVEESRNKAPFWIRRPTGSQ